MSLCGHTCGPESMQWLGYIAAAVAVAFFGSNFIPVKKFDTGDGLFFQWVMCVGIWLVGMVVNVIQQQPPFFLPVLLGGFLWVTGEGHKRMIMVSPLLPPASPLRQHLHSSHYKDDWSHNGADCVGVHQPACRMDLRKVGVAQGGCPISVMYCVIAGSFWSRISSAVD